MPVYLNGNSQGHLGWEGNGRSGKPIVDPGASGPSVTVGLINNMGDAALEATERQFFTLLSAAAGGMSVRLSLYALPNVPRNDLGRDRIQRFYALPQDLWSSQLDGLIITGREPRTPNLKDEPYWNSLIEVLEWAEENTSSTIWSCLAGHAALLHMDGINRRRSNEKRCGVFNCVQSAHHPLLAGLPACIKVPHSRWNDIPEDELAGCGYSVLTRAEDAGVDTIVKQRNSLFVFFQGHPEYEADTLLLEYRRDVKRYLRGETNTYPSMPRSYFDQDATDALAALGKKALVDRNQRLLTDVEAALDGKRGSQTWAPTAARMYANWLRYLHEQKQGRTRHTSLAVSTQTIPVG
jgi:homoserine O-succinyltransferase